MPETLKNLTKAFIGESQARNRYTYYAKIAQKEGYEQIGAIFLETAEQEKTHAKRLFEHIQKIKGDMNAVIVEAESPNVYGNTIENLKAAISGEHHEYTSMYPDFADIADKEGYSEIALRMRAIAKAEEHHEQRYKKLLEQLETGTIFKKEDSQTVWICRECGYMHIGNQPPEECPSCDHPKAFYQVQCENY
ncbi:MAG TPA: rubrerythrin family protein [Candidatus Pacearchaeota archaeon]|nr:rubrerythrin family protein [Candidatus Pacearchaeota archaeon]HOU45975.1 rubrerythrin family protein [Candidatus Pacearchaeota archaeon]HPM08781.1 rubrerythrin family protein [Candidatus Pacearchaeota archaeon]HQI74626.1 rubrerythrin family protein [Candidatus Pacearchaeota archaeon]